MDIVNIAELKSHLSEVISKISETGGEVVIGKYGKPVAKIVPFSVGAQERALGFGKHLVMSEISNMQAQVDVPLDEDTFNGFYK